MVARPEPFRAMLEQAFEAEGRRPPPALVKPRQLHGDSDLMSDAGDDEPRRAPVALERRLDQILLAGGVTPPRGLRAPASSLRREVPLRLEAPVASASSTSLPPTPFRETESLLRSLDATPVLGASAASADLDITAKLERPAAVDAALQDTLAAVDATREIPAQRLQRAISHQLDDVSTPRGLISPAPRITAPNIISRDVPEPVSAIVPKIPESITRLAKATEENILAGATLENVASIDVANTVKVDAKQELPRPPPLPRKPPVATSSPPPVLTAPPPRVMQILNEDATIPGLSPVSSTGNSSSSGKVLNQSDLYRLQLEFDDTPARPLPALASLQPLPLLVSPLHAPSLEQALNDALDRAEDGDGEMGEGPALVDPIGLAGVESTDLNRIPRRVDDLEGIEDLDELARALGLKSVADISIPSGEGAPVIGDDELFAELPPVRELQANEVSAIRRAAVMAALGEGEENVFATLGGSSEESAALRPALQGKAAVPVIVRIPSRPKVSAEAREQARKLYLSAVEELGKGDRVGAIGHLKLAIHYDDGVQLYRDLLVQLEKSSKSDEQPVEDAAPALMVMKSSSGRMTTARSEWQHERRR